VPSCEFFPIEAIRTNAIGAENVMNAALTCNVKNMIVLSTDKAVYPINAMGMSKALMEKLMIAKARSHGDKGTIFCLLTSFWTGGMTPRRFTRISMNTSTSFRSSSGRRWFIPKDSRQTDFRSAHGVYP